MTHLRSLNWFLVLGLGAVAMLRPVTRIVGSQLGIDTSVAAPIVLTIGISIVWVLVIGLRNNGAPVLTLVLAGMTYGALSIVLSGILSPIIDGHLDGPLANPVAIVPVLLVNAIWGLAAGALALLVQRARGVWPPPAVRASGKDQGRDNQEAEHWTSSRDRRPRTARRPATRDRHPRRRARAHRA